MKNFALVACLTLSGCFKTNLENFVDQEKASPGFVIRKVTHTLINGLVPLNEIDAKAACGSKQVYSVSTRYNGVSMIANFFTVGIYVPMFAKITCTDQTRAELNISQEDAKKAEIEAAKKLLESVGE